jgi:hypothetical protein
MGCHCVYCCLPLFTAAAAALCSLLNFGLSMAPDTELHADFYGQVGNTYYGRHQQLAACMRMQLAAVIQPFVTVAHLLTYSRVHLLTAQSPDLATLPVLTDNARQSHT